MAKATGDKDLIEKFGKGKHEYELVARLIKGIHRGVLWRGGSRLLEVTANSNEEAMRLLHKGFYQRMTEGMTNVALEAGKIEGAFTAIWPALTDGQKKMLRAHLNAPNRCLTSTQLAEAAGYATYSAANLWYGLAGWMLFGELPRLVETDEKSREPTYTFWIAEAPDRQQLPREQWIWQMRPEVARALESTQLVG